MKEDNMLLKRNAQTKPPGAWRLKLAMSFCLGLPLTSY